jgi:hypothetical protein
MPIRNPVDQPGRWIDATLDTGWYNYGSPVATAGYRKDSHGVVWLKGGVVADPGYTTVFTLPTGYRPPDQAVFLVYVATEAPYYYLTPTRLDIFTTGEVSCSAVNVGYLSLDTISFLAGS